MDERLKWLETRITSSLRPRNEDLKNLFLNDENRLAFYEFINNEDVKRLYVYIRPPRQITASQLPPFDLKSKSIFFLKCNPGTKLTKDNMDQEVFYIDCTSLPLEHLELTIREVFLPLLGINQPSVTGAGINGDKLMDILHRLMAAVEVTQGHVEGRIVLNLPSIEVLAEAASSVNRRASVLHVLETTVIGWIKQIRTVLKHDPQADLYSQFGGEPGPLDEIKMWEKQLERLHSINAQLDSDIAGDILQNLEQANSQYAHSFRTVRKDIDKAVQDTNKILNFLSTMKEWFERLHWANEPKEMLILFKPMMTALLLVWTHSTYYHQIDKFHNLLRLLSNEVVHRAIAMVGPDILREPLESYTKLKDALRVCAAFRGTYLDFKDKADDQNALNITENAERLAARPQGSLFMTKMYGPHAYTPRYGIRRSDGDTSQSLEEDELWTDSPWPARNAPSFDLLNNFMERCNDVLELVETTRHFRLLAGAAEVGGAGNMSLDAMVKEIHQKYTLAMEEFFSLVDNVLSIDGSQSFERSFFKFRTVVKGLEKRLAGILRQAFSQCPTVESQLRLLEVFEGVSSRELVQAHLKDKDAQLVEAFTAELQQVKEMFTENSISPPSHYNMPPIVSRLMWVHALQERIRIPMEKLRQVSPHSLEGDSGWQMRDTYNSCMTELETYQNKLVSDWRNNITAELTLRLKQPLLVAEDYDEDLDLRPQIVHVNLDPQLLLLLREIRYLGRTPFNIKLPEGAKELIRNTNSFELSVTATRLETIVSKYNTIMRTITSFERPMFERKLAKIDILFEQGLQEYTWKMKESADFIETAMSLVCLDVHQNLDIVQTDCHDVVEITVSWCKHTLDVFKARDPQLSYPMEELLEMQNQLEDELENIVVPSGNKIHSLVHKSFEAVQISQASPAWQDYIDYIDAIVLDGLKQVTLSSLASMLNTLVQANIAEINMPESVIPILTIRLELIDNAVSFCPPLDQTTSVVSVQELVQKWLDSYLARGLLVKMLGTKGTYKDYIEADDEIKVLLSDIHNVVDENSEECKKMLEVFKDYAFLWLRDVNETFEEFLQGILSPNPLRSPNRSVAAEMRNFAAEKSTMSRASSHSSIGSAGLMGTAERSFLTPKNVMDGENEHIPSLDEFDAEIDIYKTARDEIQALQDYHNVGWVRVDLQPIKQVLTTYASKWMWTFTKYLSNQVSDMLEKLDLFLKRIEPEIESITGEERDTASFMKMMRLFNEVSAQQNEMEGKFTAMHRTMILLKKYGQSLPENTQFLFNAAPGRWNSLKTKVSLAKQRLGPRIQEESARITQDLEAFSTRVNNFNHDMENSDVYSRDCSVTDSWNIIDRFSKKLLVLENEAQDLIELQELLETSVVNFSILPQCRYELNNLKQLWETVRVIDEQQGEWKRHRWQKMNTKFLREETNKQLEIVRNLSEDIFTWDVYMGLHESITTIQSCLPLIDDLSNPAMRTRHWKQLVRVTGGALTIDNDMLKRMTLGELLSLGLQKHVDDVRAIVQRAAKDLTIEQSLKTYEEVWLSKVFELRTHIRTKCQDTTAQCQDNQSEVASEAGGSQVQGTQPSKSQVRANSRVSNQSSISRNKRTSITSLPASLMNIADDNGPIQLLMTTDPIFEELEGHQVSLQTMQSSSAAGSFLDEVMKWQKRLQTIEDVLTTWLEVQEKWTELEEVFSAPDVKTSLSHDANRFSKVNHDFRLLMRATEKNPNVLQCCSRKNIRAVLENMNHLLESCRRSLLNHLERRRQLFPRFYFLSMEDVLHIICNGYDLNQINLYINKLFCHVDEIIFEETDEENEKFNFIITGVKSKMGESLMLQQPVACEGSIEAWLSSLINSLKTTLQYQTSTALGHEQQKHTRNIQSAGARRVPIKPSPTSSLTKVNKENGDKPPSRQPSQQSVHKRGEASDSRPPSEAGDGIPGTEYSEHSWILDHVKEIVYLTTKIQLTDYVQNALKDMEQGQREALQDAVEKIERNIIATTVLLNGLEGEQENEVRKRRAKSAASKDSQQGLEKDTDMMSESIGIRSVAPSIKGSMVDVMNESGRAGMSEEQISKEDEGAPTTDTMNLTMEIQDIKPSESKIVDPQSGGVAVDEVDHVEEDVRLLLFPCQIDKLMSLLALLAHQRDMINRLIDVSRNVSPAKSFDWRGQLQYSYVKDNKTINVKCLNAEFDYGYEYLGSADHEILTPVTERMFVSLTQAVKSHTGSLVVGPAESEKGRIVEELSRCLGHAYYSFNCTSVMDHYQLQDIFRGLAATGCWVSFNNLNYCQPAVLSIYAQLMSTVMAALQAGKKSVHLQSDDIQLNPHGACFALLDSAVPVTPRNPDKMLIYMSASANLPDDVLKQFRIVSAPKPDTRLTVEVLLFSEGFVNGKELANKTLQLQNLWCKLFGTNTYITENVALGYDRSASLHGWSLQTLKGVVREAGANLEAAMSESSEKDTFTLDFSEKHESENQEKEGEESMVEKKNRMEDEALVKALRDTFLPRMQARDASVFSTLIQDFWPGVEVPMIFGGESSDRSALFKTESLELIKSDLRLRTAKSHESQKSLKDSINLNTPVVNMANMDQYSSLPSQRHVLEDIQDAIAVATADLGLLPGSSFQSRVVQLAHLNLAHKTIVVVGPPGCGKSECIKTFAVAERERGKTITIQSVFTKAVESEELLGFVHPKTKEWKEGLMTALLRKFCIPTNNGLPVTDIKPVMKIMQLDGEADGGQMELLQQILDHNGSVVLSNSERLVLPQSLRFIWELDSLENLSPSLLANVGVLVMTEGDVGWKIMLVQWLEHRPETDQDLLTSFCNSYMEKLVDYVSKCTQPPIFGCKESNAHPQYKRLINHTIENMVHTFCSLFESLVSPYPDLSDVEYERYFNYACIWAFAGTLSPEYRESFSCWWKETFEQYIDYPEDGTVFDYLVDAETHEFTRWSDNLPTYSGLPHSGIPSDSFVHTVNVEQLLHIVGLLTDAGKPVMLVGDNGCGKTSIINERLRTVCSGEVAEVLSLTLYSNRFTNAKLVYDRLDERLEWKHGRTYVPRGNKRLLFLIDDLNLSQVDQYGNQTATELVRQHLDDGGFYSATSHSWRYVKNVTYVTTTNPNTTANSPKLSQRLLRHFALFGCPYPGSTELETIFSTLLNSHFIPPEVTGGHHGVHDEKLKENLREEEARRRLIGLVVNVTVELQDRLRTMFLPTAQRCHYIFTIRDIAVIFKNVCLSLRQGCTKNQLLLLWQHECFWVYGRRMVNEVDIRRFRQALFTAVRKQFTDEQQIHELLKPVPPLFSNLMEQDSGIVTAGLIDTRQNVNISEEDSKTDLYRLVADRKSVEDLMEKGVEEYNKVHPSIKLALYKTVVSQVCRLARTIASPHEGANTVLVADGCPGRCSVIIKLAAHLCAYSIYQINPSPANSTTEQKREQFKQDLVQGYTRAGTKGERILLLLHEEELVDEDFLVYLTEFIVSGSIMHLFSYEEQTTIINSIRTEVTQAGLTYTRDVAWNFFLKTVRKNFRVCLIASNGGEEFQRRCREYPAFTKSVNFIWFGHWTKTQLVDHATYHLKNVRWLNSIQRENIAHMLASMHIVLRQQDGQENSSGEYHHITNTAYEKFVERFICIASARHKEVNDVQQSVTETLTTIQKENEVATKLKKQLEHEMIVLEERKAGTIRILSQIGQDRAITEQQIKVVKHQLEKITKLKKLLPEYQVAHERAVYKAIAIVADTKKVVKNMNIEKLTDLRGMSKPIIDIEDLMAAIIMILKSPSADLTWQKGAKRQMANLERFMEELMTFDDNQLPEETLNLVEPYLKKPSFDAETMESKTNNSACGSLCRWVKGVVRYHRMMLSKVKPLHQKVDETAQQVDIAEHKMNTLESKHKALEIRLADLARGFEEATIDKNEQEEKTVKMKKMLDTAAELRKILRGERKRCQQIFDSFKRRLIAIPGGCAMAAGFAVYLGPYHHNHRRAMLTVHWPNCLRERGVPLVVDSIDGVRGRVVDWSINFLKTASGASSVYDVDYSSVLLEQQNDTNRSDPQESTHKLSQEGSGTEQPGTVRSGISVGDVQTSRSQADVEGNTSNRTKSGGDTTSQTVPEDDGVEKSDKEKEDKEEKDEDTSNIVENEATESETGVLERIQEEQEDDVTGSIVTESTAPLLSITLYNRYIRSLIKLLVGEKTLTDWLCKDFGPRQLENAAILCSSWQRPPMLIDPTGEGAVWLGRLNNLLNDSKLISLDMTTRSDNNVLVTLEKAITRGKPVLLRNCEEHIDNFITPLMYHRNTAPENGEDEEPRMIMFCGRRTLCHRDFKFYMATQLPKPKFNPEIASTTTMINFGASHDTLTEDLLTRAFARIRTDLYQERCKALRNLQLQKDTLFNLSNTVKDRVFASGQEAILSSPKALQFITDLTEAKLELAGQISQTQSLLDDLDTLRDELYPLARRAARLYSILRSLVIVHNEYQFTLAHFIKLFDEAVGGKLPKLFNRNFDGDDGYEVGQEISTWEDATPPRITSGVERTEKPTTEKTDAEKQKSDKPVEETKPSTEEEGEAGTSEKKQDENIPEEAITAAAKKLISTPESEELPPIDIPDTERLPTEGVAYSSLSINQVKQLMDSLTSLFYHRVKQSLFEEDSLLFASLMCLNIQAESGENFSTEEMALLLQGNPGLGLQLSLSDFDCRQPIPTWLPKEKWEDILALSVLPGPLDSICVNFAENTEMWKEWYKTAYPEREPLPVAPARPPSEEKVEEGDETGRGNEKGANYGSPDLGPLSDFHQLLIIRMLRPDRLPAALVRYIDKHLNLNLPAETDSGLADILLDTRHHNGVLLLLPPRQNTHPVKRLRVTQSPVQTLLHLAKVNNVSIEQVKIGDGCEIFVDEAIDTAEKNEGWVVIEDLHLAKQSLLNSLQSKLQRLKISRATLSTKKQSNRFCVWLTTEPCNHIPDLLIQGLHKVSWNYLLSVDSQSETKSPDKQQCIPTLNYLAPHAYFKTAVVKTLKEVPSSVWDKVREQSPLIKALIFGAAVIEGALRGRQLFGSIGLSQWAPFSYVQMVQAIDIITTSMLKTETEEPNLEDVCYGMAKYLYNCMVVEEVDRTYIDTLTRYVFTTVYKDPASEIRLGSTLVPTPPANVDPQDYGDWFERIANEMALESLQLHVSVEKECNEASSVVFVRNLDRMFETQNMEAGDLALNTIEKISIPKLRSALDICVEELPPMLELGAVPQLIMKEYTFPYHRPSVVSMLSSASSMIPESIGYVLMQECLWLNSVLCHIRQEISDLQSGLLGGAEALPKSLTNTIFCLQEEYVPVSWIHPNCQPCTHTLVSWLHDLRKRYDQLSDWVKRGMVPTYKNGVYRENPAIGRGSLTTVWLGGLVNPQALLTALRQEKAIVGKTSIDQVKFECVVLDSADTEEYDLDEGGIFITNIHLQGASWSFDNDSLSDPSGSLANITCLYIRPVTRTEQMSEDVDARDLGGETADDRGYQCPIYMNKSRQVLVGYFPLNGSPSSDRWILSRTALVLDPGLPEDGCKKSRSYMLLQRMTPSSMEDHGEEEEEHFEEQLVDGQDTARSEQSERSQLSYEPMTPKADPLPIGLGIQREPVMVTSDTNPTDANQPAQPRKGSGQNGQVPHPPSETRSNTSQQSVRSNRSITSQRSQGSQRSQTSQKAQNQQSQDQRDSRVSLQSRGTGRGVESVSPTKNANNNNETRTPVNQARRESQSSNPQNNPIRKESSTNASKAPPRLLSHRRDSKGSRGSLDSKKSSQGSKESVPLEIPRGSEPAREQLDRQPEEQRGMEKVYSTESVDQSGHPPRNQQGSSEEFVTSPGQETEQGETTSYYSTSQVTDDDEEEEYTETESPSERGGFSSQGRRSSQPQRKSSNPDY